MPIEELTKCFGIWVAINLTFFADRTGQSNTTPKTKPTTLQVMHGSRVGQ